MKTLDLELILQHKSEIYKSNNIVYSVGIKNQNIILLSDFTYCKEVLMYFYHKQIEKSYFKNLKLIINFHSFSTEALKIKIEKINKAIKILNMFGSINNWPKIKIYKIKSNYTNMYFFVFDLPYQWFKFPQLLSLVTFIIESCSLYNIEKYNTIEDFIASIKIDTKNNLNTISIFFDIENWIDNIPLLINNYNNIFKNEISTYNYNNQNCLSKMDYDFSKYSGIKSLCQYKSLNTILNKKLKILGEK